MEAAIVITKDNIPNQKGEAKLSSQLRSSSRAYLSYNQGPEDQGPDNGGSHVWTLSFQQCMKNTELSQKNLFLLPFDSHLLCDQMESLCLFRTQFHENFDLDQEFSNCARSGLGLHKRGLSISHISKF